MTHKPSVHIEFREEGWAVLREGNKRATSSHPTQAEAAESGRDLARRDKTQFFLHAQDGRIREHRDYSDEPSDKGVVDQTSETVGAVADAVTGTSGAVAQALGGERDATEPAEPDLTSGATQTDPSIEETHQDTGDTEETRGPTDAGSGGLSETPEERYADYEVYDRDDQRIGLLNELFVAENDEPEYIGVGTDSAGNRSILVPVEAVTIDDRLHRMMISRPRSFVEAGPSLGYEDEVTPRLERRVRLYYGLEALYDAEARSGHAGYYPGDPGLTEPERVESSTANTSEDEVRVQRAEEEIRVQTREREAGAMRVRKRVRTDRERLEVPKKRVEVTVERVPVDGERVPVDEGATTPEIGEEEIVVPVIEEEIVVEKRPVIKEEIRIRKQVVEDTEVVEEDVRREEVEIDDQTRHDSGSHADEIRPRREEDRRHGR